MIDRDDPELQKTLEQALDQGVELAKSLISSKEKTMASAIVLGTAVGSLYWTLSKIPGYEEDTKRWLDAFFTVMTNGLKNKDIKLSVTWCRKEAGS